MNTQSPAPGVFQLTRFGAFSCHLLLDTDGLTLIDTGLPGSAGGIARAARTIGAPLARILITHAHHDHCGSLDRLRQDHPTIAVIASARTADLMAGDRMLRADEAGYKLRGGFMTCRTRPSRLIEDGERVGAFRAIFTPGHAPGHVSYLHETTGFLFTGDALHTAGGRLTVSGEFRLTFPFPYFATWSRPLALDSARRLRDLKPAGLFPAHGQALLHAASTLREAVDRAERSFGEHLTPRGAGATA